MSRIESTRRHGPFDPRFRGDRSLIARASRRPYSEPPFAPPPTDVDERRAIARWESEGGALVLAR